MYVGKHAFLVNAFSKCINEKIRKGCRTHNLLTNIRVKNRGIAISVCNTDFWYKVIPILAVGSEGWVLNQNEKKIPEILQ